ncbi:hypothetical protein F5X96DRAFT_618479 [Biscogniauxia mediterranea]|nr:hypothetical protein F5X96DRAFT_618479 [Biscogniauxia mediterranea]
MYWMDDLHTSRMAGSKGGGNQNYPTPTKYTTSIHQNTTIPNELEIYICIRLGMVVTCSGDGVLVLALLFLNSGQRLMTDFPNTSPYFLGGIIMGLTPITLPDEDRCHGNFK